jgi:lantibiotic modifying enzyme
MINRTTGHDNMSPMLLRAANTILCNYSMTTTPNLENGRMGVCLFLYEYARLTGIKEFGDIADGMIDIILKILHKEQNNENIISLSGVGIGVIYLISHQFLEDTDEHDSLEEVDKFLQKTIEVAKKPSEEVIHAALYYIYRFINYRIGIERKIYRKLARHLLALFQDNKNKGEDNMMSEFIFQNATQINKLSQNEKKIYSEVPSPLEMTFAHIKEPLTTEKMWYRLLFNKNPQNRKIDEGDFYKLCQNCFYDADRSVGMLCCYALTIMNQNK